MKRKKCKTAGRRKKKIGIITSLILILCILLGYIYLRYAEGYRTFHAPEHEKTAAEGTPGGDHVRHYENLPVKEGYMIGIDTSPHLHDGKLYLNAANCEGNTVWLLVRVYHEDELIAETGIFYPGEYVADVSCSKKLASNDKILIKILSYEPDTYHSEGVAQISAAVTVE